VRLRDLGAEVIEMPAIRLEALDPAPLYSALGSLRDYAWVMFTSQNAVELVWRAMRTRGLDARSLGHARIAAIGRATADALLGCGVAADVVPERFVAESLMEALERRNDVKGRRVLLPRAAEARDVLPHGLDALGAEVDVVPIYRTVLDGAGAAKVAGRLRAGEIDLVTLSSSSTARFFVEAVGAEAARAVPVASIGPVTSAAARALGLHVAVESAQSTIPALVDAIVARRR
jgi:uroporphyrinogen III methyltransferase / synthase